MYKKFLSQQSLIILLALIISVLPIINIPFTWIAVFFHELSHAIIALLTGGSVKSIRIYPSGSGLCYSSGGIRFLILQAGYIGAILWGLLIYNISTNTKPKHAHIIVLSILFMITASLVLWSRDIFTWVILLTLFALFYSVLKLQTQYFVQLALKFVGVYVLLDAIRSPLYLIDGRHYGDAASLSDLTHIPEIIWAILWFAIGISSLIYLWKKENSS